MTTLSRHTRSLLRPRPPGRSPLPFMDLLQPQAIPSCPLPHLPQLICRPLEVRGQEENRIRLLEDQPQLG